MPAFDLDIHGQVYQFFIEESLEFLQVLESGLLDLRHDQSVPKIHELMRAAHSIKGGAASMGLDAIKAIAHQMEDVFRALYRLETPIDETFESLLLQAYDCLRLPLMEQIQTGQHDAEAALNTAKPILDQLADCLGDALHEIDHELPTAAELGIDLVAIIFSGDVAQGIERIETVLAQPDDREVSGEIRAQAEVFVGVGQLVNMLGFVSIAQATLAALDAQPDAAIAIGAIALADFKAAQAGVLAKTLPDGGAPSAALLQFATPQFATPQFTPQPMAFAELPTETESDFAASAQTLMSPLDLTTALSVGLTPGSALSAEGVLPPLDLTTNLDAIFGSGDSPQAPIAPMSEEEFLTAADLYAPDLHTSDLHVSALHTPDLHASDLHASNLHVSALPVSDLYASDLYAMESRVQLDSNSHGQSEIRNQTDGNSNGPNYEPNLTSNPQLQTTDSANTNLDDIFGKANAANTNLDDIFGKANAANTNLDDIFGKASATNTNLDAMLGSTEMVTVMPVDAIALPQAAVPTSESESLEPAIIPPTVADPAIAVTPAKPITAPTPAKSAPFLSNTVKVDLPRLERLNNQIGELITQENGAILQVRQMQGLVNRLSQRLNQFERTTKSLQDLADKSQNTRARLQVPQLVPQLAASLTSPMPRMSDLRTEERAEFLPFSLGTDHPNFDPLQMDSYSELHTLIQGVIEEMAQFGEGMRDMNLLMQQAQQTQHQKQQTLKQVRNDLLWVRMFPLGDTLQRFPRMVRDLATQHHKQVTVKLSGTNTLVDKVILEKLNDPLVHLVRNAFDHGVEPPDQRQAQGKPAEATIEIRAYYRGNQTYIEVRDDGRGIDLEKVKAKAIARNLITAAEAETLSSDRIQEFLFAPGFSTAAQVSELSGRGVGLDTVRSQIRLLKGGITIQSELGKGTTFTLRLPLTLTIAKLLVCSIGSNLLALPMDSLVSIVSIAPEEIKTLQGSQYYQIEDQLIPVYPKDLFFNHYRIPRSISEQMHSLALPQTGKTPLLLISGESEIMALPVDQILQEQELVIKPFGSTIQPPPYLYGCTILGDGSLVPVIDGTALVTPESVVPPIAAARQEAAGTSTPTILVVDDSLTARQTLCATLKKAGYHTLQARDGREALTQLQQHPQVQAVFCDVEMPNMNGFEFLTHCRQEFPKNLLPVIMVTSRSGDKHRQIAQVLGASSYLTKPFLEQDLIKTLKTSLVPA